MRRKSRRLNKKNTAKYLTHYYFRSKSKSKINHNFPKFTNHLTLPQQDKPRRIFKQELEKSDVIEGLARVIHDYVQRYDQLLKPRYQGSHFPGPRLFNTPEPTTYSPCLEDIRAFIQSIYDKRHYLHVESGIIALILLNRTNIKIHSQNWMRMVLIAMLLANKHCEDVYSVYNAKFVGLIPNLENLEINILELEFLKFLKYRLHIETETYNHYYAKLQEFFPIEEKLETISEVLTSEEAQTIPDEKEFVQSSEFETEVAEEEITPRSQFCHLMNSVGNSWQDYNYALVDSVKA